MRKTDKAKDKKLHCKDCAHSYDYHEHDHSGQPFLCKCPFFEWSRFLNYDSCDRIKPKQE